MRPIVLLVALLLGTAGSAPAATVQLSWTASSPATGVTGYRIYYGTVSGTYTANQDAGNSTTGTVGSLTEGATYYMAVKAYNASGTESVFSNEVTVVMTVDEVDPGAPLRAIIMPRVHQR